VSAHKRNNGRVMQEVSEDEYLILSEQQAPVRKGERFAANCRLLWQRRDVLRRAAFYGFVFFTVLALLIPSRYQSTARLMPPDNNQAASGLAAVAAMVSSSAGSAAGGLANEVLGVKNTSDIFSGILSSRTVQDALIQQFNLKKIYWDRRIEDAREDLSKHTDLDVERKTQIVSITVTDRDPKRATAMAQAYVDQLNRLVALLSTSSARRERMFLESRLQAVNTDLENAEKQFSQFASKNSAIDIKEQGKAMMEAAAVLQGQLIAAQSELEGLRQIYTDNNVRVRSVRARIGELQRQLEKMGGKGEDVSDPTLANDALYPSIRKLPLLGVTWADLYRQMKVQEAVFETLTKQYELAKVQEAKEIPTVKVLDAPNAPEKKVFPPRTIIILLGTSLSLIGGAIWVFGQQSWSRMNGDDPRKVLVLDAFASIETQTRNSADGESVSTGWKRRWLRRFRRGQPAGNADEAR
jgi:capsule polysaccharide export protein KpsE/RkpR